MSSCWVLRFRRIGWEEGGRRWENVEEGGRRWEEVEIEYQYQYPFCSISKKDFENFMLDLDSL